MRINGKYVEMRWLVLAVIVCAVVFYLFCGMGWLVIEATKGLVEWVF